MRLLALDDVFALVGLLAHEVDGVLEVTEHAVLVAPAVIAMTMVAVENTRGGCADLLGSLEPTRGDAMRQLFQLDAHTLHGLEAVAALERLSFLGVDYEHPRAGLFGGDLLNPGLGRACLLARSNADRTFDPGTGRALDVVEHLAAAAPVATDHVAVALPAQQIEVVARHHAAIADEHHTFEPEALLQIAQHLGHGHGIAPVAFKHVVSNRPAVDQDQPDQHLRVARLVVAAVAILAGAWRAGALEIGRGQIVEHHVDLEREQVAQGDKQRVFDLQLAFEQLIEGAIPALELPHLDPHPRGCAVSSHRANPCSLP